MKLSEITQFLKTDIWRIRERDLSRPKWFFVRILRIIILSLRGFTENRSQLRASSLTFYSLLSIVPVVAMIFGIAKGFGFERTLEKQLIAKLAGQEEVITRVIGFARALLENTKGGLVAGVGVLILFWSIIKVLGSIENSFNEIWGVKKPRSFGRKISDYLSIMLICPVLFVLSSATTVVIAGQARLIISKVALLGPVSSIILFAMKLLPFLVIASLFTFIYIFMPNTKVNFRSGLIAGITAGALYQIFQIGYITLQVGVAKYNAIYGSFAALPLFLIWLQVSWIIVLSGGELSFALQNVHTYEFEPDCLKVSNSFKKLLSLRITHLLVKHFTNGEKALDENDISRKLEIPIRLVRQILFDLVNANVVAQIMLNEERTVAYQPALSTDILTVKFVLDALSDSGTDSIPVARTEEMKQLSEVLIAFSDAIEKSPANVRLKDI
jgi:membrane protein